MRETKKEVTTTINDKLFSLEILTLQTNKLVWSRSNCQMKRAEGQSLTCAVTDHMTI
jgi:hypothetical protein